MRKPKDNETVRESQARRVQDLVLSGKTPQQAADEVGANLNTLRKAGVLKAQVLEMMSAVKEADLLDAKNRNLFANARLVELSMSEDPRVAVNAAKALVNDTSIVINNNIATGGTVTHSPGVVEALKAIHADFLEKGDVVDAEEINN